MKPNAVYNENCLETMAKMPENYIDAIITDPPYGLAFMGKKWDYEIPAVEIWAECLRILKPGGFLLSFAGTRTHHRICCNIEDAGFEIRDMIAWVYGSGFPKSLDISKAIDKMKGAERGIIKIIKRTGKDCGIYGAMPGDNTETTPETLEAKTWEGWGTALKPAFEPITVARKPLECKTVAENVLKYGTGGINIDGGRVGLNGDKKTTGGCKTRIDNKSHMEFRGGQINKEDNTKGRFPANLIHDGSPEVKNGFPDGGTSYRPNAENHKRDDKKWQGARQSKGVSMGHNDTGNASRFFYVAKASKSDRDEWLEMMDNKILAQSNQAQAELKRGNKHNESIGINKTTICKNNHPTVKPTDLMRYLCRLVTPPGGLIYDPFTGSGSTGKGARLDGFNFIGSEIDPEYCKIARRRIKPIQRRLF